MTDDIRDDLAYVKALAEEGRDTPLVNGVIYVIWGLLIGLVSLLSYAANVGWLALGVFNSIWPWVVVFALGWALSMYFGGRSGVKPGASTLGNRTANAVWLGVGIFITGFWITLMFVHDNFTTIGVPAYFLYGLMFPISFGLYGVAFFATATAARIAWLRWVAVLAWIFAALSLVLMGSAQYLLVGGIGTLLCAALPGVILMRNEPSEIV
ncbi:MAG: hypothetical protein GXP04_09710 [Alphaproteobacteria bacterium]|nr:hypothetical protein [Alphaproteobacteria bacterium]